MDAKLNNVAVHKEIKAIGGLGRKLLTTFTPLFTEFIFFYDWPKIARYVGERCIIHTLPESTWYQSVV